MGSHKIVVDGLVTSRTGLEVRVLVLFIQLEGDVVGDRNVLHVERLLHLFKVLDAFGKQQFVF